MSEKIRRTNLRDKPLVVTHRNCFDGVTAAWAFRSFNGDDFEWVQWNFGDEGVPDTQGRVVYIADFSFPRDIMADKIILPSKKTIVFDHHKTAEAELDGLIRYIREKHGINRTADEIHFDSSRSGAGITWDYFEKKHGQKRGFHSPRLLMQRENWLVNAVEDRDLWNFKIEYTKEIIAYLATVPMTMESWDAVYALGRTNVAERGRSIVQYIEMFSDKAVKTAKRETVEGYEVPTMNVQYMNGSDHLHKLHDSNPDDPFVVGFFRRSDGKWQLSFRSRDNFDCSEIAQRFGGGGHKCASGAVVEELPWDSKTETD